MITRLIDHTLLRCDATERDILKLCAEARKHRFIAVCVNPVWVPLCAAELKNSDTLVCSVAGFPLGANDTRSKAAEAALAVQAGAREVDMVANIACIKTQNWKLLESDIQAVIAATGVTVKVILETALLSQDEIAESVRVAKQAGAQFVKTSTGFNAAGGASEEAVRIMRAAAGPAMGVKASGGIRSCEVALRMLVAGANRLGTSGGVAIATCLGDTPVVGGVLPALVAEHRAICRTV